MFASTLTDPKGPSNPGCLPRPRGRSPFFSGVLRFSFLLTLSLAGMGPSAAEGADPVTFQTIATYARRLADRPFSPPEGRLPDFLQKMPYDDWRDIRFRPERALWAKEKLPFTVQFFHPGFLYDRTVGVHVVDSRGARPVAFSSELFDYGRNDMEDRVPRGLGFAGFRIHYPINTREYSDEVAVFLGGTYFRAVAQHQNYGLSARAVAIDTGLPTGEEFPYFREFWLLRPSLEDREIVLYAVVDSPSLAGAYRFVVLPGKETVIDVSGRLFPRKRIQKLCIAPLTSMFFLGEISIHRPADDFRPEVHDSDGLLVATREGEWIWRPLNNPGALTINTFETVDPVGFGLIQRDCHFDHYQDLEARYHTRPSVWIDPGEGWGKGHIELVQIPTENEYNDNIVAYWVPAAECRPDRPVRFSYRMSWHSGAEGDRSPGGRVTNSRIVRGKEKGQWKFLVEFEGKKLEQFPPEKPLTAVVNLDERTRLIEQQLYKNNVTKGWRLVFLVGMDEQVSLERLLPPHKRSSFELSAYLKLGDRVLTETWSHAHQPE
ncbi:MAG: glucan biosynthesis protein [Deltaproteobacteria bacterium]|nr:glucan biosynthesis protein [Deltaproteobacteria bacterium]